MPFADRPRVRIAHENAIVDAGIRFILGRSTGFTLAGHDPATCDVIVADHDAGLRLAGDGRRGEGAPHLMIVALDVDGPGIRAARDAGVHAYVVVGCNAREVVEGVRSAAAGRDFLCGRAAGSLAGDAVGLTARETEVLGLVSRGMKNKEVARRLAISPSTVKAHMRSLLAKLGARCRTEALWNAAQHGLLPGRSTGWAHGCR